MEGYVARGSIMIGNEERFAEAGFTAGGCHSLQNAKRRVLRRLCNILRTHHQGIEDLYGGRIFRKSREISGLIEFLKRSDGLIWMEVGVPISIQLHLKNLSRLCNRRWLECGSIPNTAS